MMGVDASDAKKFKVGTDNITSNTRITIDSTGKIGIGTTSPASLLHVNGGSIRLNNNNDGTAFRFDGLNAAGNKSAIMWFNSAGTEKWRMVVDQNANNTDDLRFYSNALGTIVMTMLQSGYVGVGTASPGAPLHIVNSAVNCPVSTEGTAGAIGYRMKNTAVNGREWRIWSNVVASGVGADGDLIFWDQTSSVRRMIINSSGNIGMGIGSPSVKLDVGGEIRGDKHSSSSANVETVSGTYTLGQSGGKVVYAFDEARGWGYNNADDAIYMQGHSSIPVVFKTNGNVGIGTTAPVTSLDISKANATLSNIQTTITNNAMAVSSTYGAGSVYWPGMLWYTTDNNSTKPKAGIWSYGDGSGSKLYFGTSNAYATGITNTALVIDASGNVGIGATGPTSILHTIASGIKTAAYSGSLFTNIATSSTASIRKSGVEITSTGTWNGSSASNVGLYVSSVTGGAANYDAIFNGGGNVGVGITVPVSKLDVNGSLGAKVSTTNSSSYTLGDEFALFVTANSLGTIISLPSAATVKGRIYIVKRVANTYSISLSPDGSDLIDGAGSYNISTTVNSRVMFMSDGGTNWYIVD